MEKLKTKKFQLINRIKHGLFPTTSVVAKITSKGQVTIPSEVRKALNLSTGDQILFEVKDNKNINVRKLTAIDTLAMQIGPQLRKDFPDPEDFSAYLDKNRQELFESIYGSINVKNSD